jgi:hypothetical protein
MSSIVIQGDTSGSITVEAPSVAGTHTLTLPKATGNIATDATVGLGQKNLIINGNMQIAQRGTSTASITSGGYYTTDRIQFYVATAGTWTMTQDTDVPSGQGFSYSTKVDCTTADASLGANDIIQLAQRIEGRNVQHLKYGTSNAESLTLSFWVKTNKTGTYVAELRAYDASSGTRIIAQNYTVSSADTWEKKTLTYVGDTATAIRNTNTDGLVLYLWLAAGSTFTSGTLATSWQTYTAGNRAVNQLNLADSTSNYLNITGIQLEVGENATPFENRMYGTELALCQRYYQKSFAYGQAPANGIYTYGSTFTCHTASSGRGAWIHFPVQMRATPSITIYGTTGTLDIFNSGWVNWTNSAPVPRETGMYIDSDTGITVTVGYTYLSRGDWTAQAEL